MTVENYVYFQSGPNRNQLYRCNIVGASTPQLLDSSCGPGIFVSGNYVYFQSGPNRNQLHKRKIDGTGTSQLLDNFCGPGIFVSGDYVYFQGNSGFDQLWRHKIDGTGTSQFLDSSCGPGLFVSGDYVYFQSGPNRNQLHKRKIDGTGTSQLLDSSCGPGLFVSGNYVYFQSGPNRNQLHKRKIDGTGTSQLLDSSCGPGISVSGDYVFFQGGQNKNKLFRRNTDGTADAQLLDGSCGTNSKIISTNYNRISTIKNGLVAYYPLISDTKDYSGNNHNSIANTKVSFGPGLFGGSTLFTQSGASITTPASLNMTPNQFTISAWVCLNSTSTVDSKTESQIVGGLVVNNASKKLSFYFNYVIGNSNPKLVLLTSTVSISVGHWHHVGVTYDHETHKFAFYIDRKMVDMQDLSSLMPSTALPKYPFYGNIGGSSQAVGQFNGSISDVFLLDCKSEKVDMDLLGGIMTPQTTHPIHQEAQKQNLLAVTNIQKLCTPSWWAVIPVLGWVALQLAANCEAKPTTKPPSPESIVAAIYHNFNLIPPAALPAGRKPTRQELGIEEGVRIHIDVGGEGRTHSHGMKTGFNDSINLQAADGPVGDGTKQTQPPKGPIPRLVRMAKWEQNYPFADNFADYITMQNAPLHPNNVNEMARVLKPNGEISLWIDPAGSGWENNIEQLARKLKGKVKWNDVDEFHGDAGYGKTTIVANSLHDDL